VSAPHLVVTTSFVINPAVAGGQVRILGLYGALAAHGVTVDIVAMAPRQERARTLQLAPGLREIRIPMSPEHDRADGLRWERAGVPVTDLSVALDHDLTPAFAAAIAEAAQDAAAVVVSHPFTLPAVRAATSAPVIYEAHNVEADLKRHLLGATAPDLVVATEAIEAEAATRAEFIMACSSDDAARLQQLYDIPGERFIIVPNGIDVSRYEFSDAAIRRRRKRQLGLDRQRDAVFIGSWHEPNLEAVRAILVAARQVPEIHFIVCGGAGLAFRESDVPANVDLCGTVDAAFLTAVLGLADVAVNPMQSGSGTNLKMLSYAACGVPIISSAIGTRGLGLVPDVHYRATAPGDLAQTLRAQRAEDPDMVATRVANAREHVREQFDWRAIAAQLVDAPRWRMVGAGVVA
jgi:glycosyltransferase involved in cell wall biosynthesis